MPRTNRNRENSRGPETNTGAATNGRENRTESSQPTAVAASTQSTPQLESVPSNQNQPAQSNVTSTVTEEVTEEPVTNRQSAENGENDTTVANGPREGAPPTYEESANHLTLEYGGYFLPYDSRPMPSAVLHPTSSALAPVTPSLSLSRMNPPRRSRSLQEAHQIDRSPRGRRHRRVGDFDVPSERVLTQPAVNDAEQDDQTTNDKCTKLLLPPMHICMATTCLVFNCVLPGSGTLLAAFALYCCTKPSEWSCGKKIASNCLSLLIALAQLILTPVLLIGWIWSILWGFAYVGVSHQEYHGIKDDDDEEEEEEVIAAINSGRLGHRLHDQDEDDISQIWAMDYHRYSHPYSAPSVRRMSIAAASGNAREQNQGQRMLRATRSYGYVEVQGRNALYHPTMDNFPAVPRQQTQQRPPGSAGSSSTNRPLSQTTLTSYINDGMFLPNTASQRNPASMVTVDM